MNEIIFFIHVSLLIGLSVFSLKTGEKALTCFIVLMGILSNLFVLKQIQLFSLTVTASDAYAICGIFSLNMIQEYYGEKAAKKTVFINFFFLFIFGILSTIHIQYIPSIFDKTQHAYLTLLSPSFRLILASLICYFFSQKIDLFLFSFFRRNLFKRSLSLASIASSSISQIFDTTAFTFLALYGQVNAVLEVILLSLTIKFITILLMSPMMNLSKKIIMRTPC
jgi:uncharacterized integral membrane protein (TIGR00697 family)